MMVHNLIMSNGGFVIYVNTCYTLIILAWIVMCELQVKLLLDMVVSP